MKFEGCYNLQKIMPIVEHIFLHKVEKLELNLLFLATPKFRLEKLISVITNYFTRFTCEKDHKSAFFLS